MSPLTSPIRLTLTFTLTPTGLLGCLLSIPRYCTSQVPSLHHLSHPTRATGSSKSLTTRLWAPRQGVSLILHFPCDENKHLTWGWFSLKGEGREGEREGGRKDGTLAGHFGGSTAADQVMMSSHLTVTQSTILPWLARSTSSHLSKRVHCFVLT